ncbi:ninein-like protein isoform X5 [Myiozetetes cayanensis]|uniref:ninein-like protein isoform X5 n=1 Tax=Myiozetetes cayanensis TaxID=478635 RepID=UPI00215E8031|nr:ninein-like protein isoform X5 [Myiozetetes cayanensis]
MEEQVSLAELPAALDSTLMVPRSGLQHAAGTSYGYKLRCLWTQVRKIARERDKARLDLEKAERRCLHLGRELDEQYVALKHTQSKLKDFQAEIEAKELLLQQAVSHQAKLEADTQFLQGKEASLRGRLNHVMKQNTELQNKVREMTEKLSASEELVLELQKELNHIVKEKLGQVEPHSPEFLSQSERFAEIVLEYERQCQVLYDQNRALRRELQRLRLQLQESRAETGLPARGLSLQGSFLPESPSPSLLVPASAHTEMSLPVEQLQEQLQDLKVQLETKSKKSKEEISHPNVEVHGCELTGHKAGHSGGPGSVQLQSQRLAEAEWTRGTEEAARLEHHQKHAACWMEMELLQQQLKASQEKVEHEHLLQAAVEQAEGLEHSLRSAEAVLAERAARLRDAQAQLSRNKLLIEDLRGENRGFAVALQAAELQQKSMKEKNQLLEEQASALKQLIGKITPASLSG